MNTPLLIASLLANGAMLVVTVALMLRNHLREKREMEHVDRMMKMHAPRLFRDPVNGQFRAPYGRFLTNPNDRLES